MKYEFQCPDCKGKVEVECKADDYDFIKESLACDKCGKKLERVFTPPVFLGTTGGYDAVVGTASWQK